MTLGGREEDDVSPREGKQEYKQEPEGMKKNSMIVVVSELLAGKRFRA